MISADYVGLLGAVILIIAWLFETVEGIKEHKVLVDFRFAVASLTAIVLLIFYSWMIENIIFFWLNISLAIIILLEIAYTLIFKNIWERE